MKDDNIACAVDAFSSALRYHAKDNWDTPEEWESTVEHVRILEKHLQRMGKALPMSLARGLRRLTGTHPASYSEGAWELAEVGDTSTIHHHTDVADRNRGFERNRNFDDAAPPPREIVLQSKQGLWG